MDTRKPHKFHPIHRSTLRRMRLRKDFADSVSALSSDEEAEFEALRLQVLKNTLVRGGEPAPQVRVAAAPPAAHEKLTGTTERHEHLPAFSPRAAHTPPPPRLPRQGLFFVSGIVLAFGLCVLAGIYAAVF